MKDAVRGKAASATASLPAPLLLAAIATWYVCAAAAVVLTKLAFNAALGPGGSSGGWALTLGVLASLCAANMAALAVGAGAGLVLRGASVRGLGALLLQRRPAPLSTLAWEHAVGHGAATAAVLFADASVVQALKAMEPVFAVFVGGDASEMHGRKAVSVVMVMAAGLACGSLQVGGAHLFTGPAALGFGLASLSNLAFALRNVAAKQRAAVAGNGGTAALLFLSSADAAVAFGALAMVAAAASPHPGSVVAAFLSPGVAPAIAASSVAFAAYQLASGIVLEAVSPVTHALVNVMKRVFIVVATAAVLGTPLSPRAAGAFGVLLLGLGLHSDALMGALVPVGR